MATKTWAEVKASRLTPAKQREIRGRAAREVVELTLRELREQHDKTQAEVAEAASMGQSELSRVERRDDVKLSTLRRVVSAIGGELEVSAVIDGERIKLNVG